MYRDKDSQDVGDLQTGTRVCKSCKVHKSMQAFYLSPKGHRRRTCGPCLTDQARTTRENNRDQYRAMYRARDLRRKYGLTKQAYDAMLCGQEGRCAICLEPFGDRAPHIDHDHKCCPGELSCGKCIRKLLCFGCNAAIGMFKDDPARVLRAARYLMEDE